MITVTEFGSSESATLPPRSITAAGFGETVRGEPKLLTLSTFGAVSVSSLAVLALMPISASTCKDLSGDFLIPRKRYHKLSNSRTIQIWAPLGKP